MSVENKVADRIYPHVFIDGVNVGYQSKDALKKKYEAQNAKLKQVNLTVWYKDAPIATFDATNLDLKTNGPEIVDKAFIIGRTEHVPSRMYQKVATILGIRSFAFDTKVTYSKGALEDFINNVQDQYEIPAKNALFTFENGRVVNFRKEEKGNKLNIDSLYKDVDKQVSSMKRNPSSAQIMLTDHVVEPEITLAEANNFGIEELIGEGKSDYSHSIPNRIENVILGASKFNGVLIPKDKVFSFDETIGDISQLTGYKQAYIIKNGKTVLGDGGGVCQVSTTLFRAALNTGLPVMERHAHDYRVYYYENDAKPGFDATIFSPSVDLKIKNDTGASILILTEVDKEHNLLYFRLYGKKDNRKVELSEPTVYDVQPAPPPLYQDDPTLKKGVTKQVDFAASGAKSVFKYKVTRDGQILTQDTFYSVYKPWQAVYLVGQAD